MHSNSVYGLYLTNSSNCGLTDNTASSNDRGIYLIRSNSTVISGNKVSENNAYGILTSYSNYNIISGNTANKTFRGIHLDSSDGNTVSGNTVASTSVSGLFMCAGSDSNRVFNNHLNNMYNADIRNTKNTWNTTRTAGTNIVGGPYIGGNFWANPSGTGFSQKAQDADGDGIADSKYAGKNYTDYLPLISTSGRPQSLLPVANFTANITSGNGPLTVQFTDTSQYATGRNWDFENDGTVDSSIQNPVHVFTASGTCTVNLTVTNANGTNSKFMTITVHDLSEPVTPTADFTANITSGYAPLAVQFTDLSQNTVSWSWDFDSDGIYDSYPQNPIHVYEIPGTYAVNLSASNQNGTTSKTAIVNVLKESNSGGDSSKGGSSSGGSSGGGDGGVSPEPAKNVEVKELSQVFITNGKPIKFDFTKNATCVVYVGFDAKKTVGKTTTIAEQLKNKSTLVSNLTEGEVYRYFNVWVGNSGFAGLENIENPAICFKVEKAWIQEKGIDQASIALNRYSNKTWEQMPVNLSGEDSKYLYFTARVREFSFFAITGTTTAFSEESVTEIGPEQETGSIEEEKMGNKGSVVEKEPEQVENLKAPGLEMASGVACLLAASLYIRKIKRQM